ncbi:DUF4446 family protein [Nocardiopsis mangrovi]|uniref:DUF4446 family protein n=1 Tax=Nocardiopsis mangrovi TaxID=1179818 RepID=A0ABV9DYU5_9ACTN
MLGVLTGVSGVALGGYALLRTRQAIDDCRELIQRMLPDTSGFDVRAIRDVAVVRYDALEEMGGARSFSLAMLNSAGDGVVVTSINGRSESRTYAKIIEAGRAYEALSPEEYRAMRAARLGQGPGDMGTRTGHAGAADPESGEPPVRPLGGEPPEPRRGEVTESA